MLFFSAHDPNYFSPGSKYSIFLFVFWCFFFRKWKTNWKRYSESSSHSGTASSSRTAASPDSKIRSPRLPCKTQRPLPGLLFSFGVSYGQFLKIRLHRAWFPSHSVETKPTFQDELLFLLIGPPVSHSALTPSQRRGKTFKAHVHIRRKDIFVKESLNCFYFLRCGEAFSREGCTYCSTTVASVFPLFLLCCQI